MMGKATSLVWTLAISAMVLLACSTSKSGNRSEKRAQTAAYINERLAQHEFKIYVTYMYPQRYPSKAITSDYFVKLSEGRLISNLPYFGQVQVPTLTYPSQGLNFDLPVKDFSEKYNEKKHRTDIKLHVSTDEDYYEYLISIYDNGNADITVRPQKRDIIRFSGELDM